MIGPHRIEGYAIVSADGMIADGDGAMPDSIRNEADQKFLQAELDRAAVVVHGRHSHEGGPRAARRKRLILTRRIASIAPDPSHPNALFGIRPARRSKRPSKTLGAGAGTIAVIGGTEVFGLFLPLYDAFHLTRAANAKIPGGRPLFPRGRPACDAGGRARAPRPKPGPRRDLDAAAGMTLTTWER